MTSVIQGTCAVHSVLQAQHPVPALPLVPMFAGNGGLKGAETWMLDTDAKVS